MDEVLSLKFTKRPVGGGLSVESAFPLIVLIAAILLAVVETLLRNFVRL